MKLFQIEPEVAGNRGHETRYVTGEEPGGRLKGIDRITYLNFEFEYWLGDCLVEGLFCYLVTKAAAEEIVREQLTGIEFRAVHVTLERQFHLLSGWRRSAAKFPSWTWLVPRGLVDFKLNGDAMKWSGHDCCWGTNLDYHGFKKSEDGKRTRCPSGIWLFQSDY